MSLLIVNVLTRVIVPSQANVTVPPPAIAARRLASSQVSTTPAAEAACCIQNNGRSHTQKSLQRKVLMIGTWLSCKTRFNAAGRDNFATNLPLTVTLLCSDVLGHSK